MGDYKVEFDITPPIEATAEQVDHWIQFCLGTRGDIPIDNPLSEYDLEGLSWLRIS